MSQDDAFRRLSERLATYRQDMIDLQRELVRRNAVGPENGGPGEGAKAAYLKDLLESWGLKVDNYPAPDPLVAEGERPNLVAWLPGRRPEKVWVLSHLDVVPEGDISLWHSDPFDLKVEGDRLYGRGVEDDHHGIVSSLMAAKAFLDLGLTPERTVALALVADEETGSHLGLEYLVREHRRAILRAGPDHRARRRQRRRHHDRGGGKVHPLAAPELLGQQAHASRPQVGRNTLRACAHVIVALDELQREFPLQNPLFRPPESTFEPTRKEENVGNINTIPGRDVFYLDCRVLPEIDLEQVKARVQAIGDEVAQKFGVTLEMEPVQDLQAAPATAPEAPVVLALQRAIREVYGREASPQGIGGGTVAAFFRQQGLPAAVWMKVSDTAHPAQRILPAEQPPGGRPGSGARVFWSRG